MTASGFFDLNELGPGLPLTAVSFCAAAPNSDVLAWTLDLSSNWFCRRSMFLAGHGLLGPSPGNDSEGQY